MLLRSQTLRKPLIVLQSTSFGKYSTSAAGIKCSYSQSNMPETTLEKGTALKPKLKLLCLHGYTQNAEVFRMRIGSFRSPLKSRIDFEFVDAPFKVADTPPSASTSDQDGEPGVEAAQRLTWWVTLNKGEPPLCDAEYQGWTDVTLPALIQAIKHHKPDGLLGFSQGAIAVALLLASMAAGQFGADMPPLKCAIMVSGLLPRDPELAAFLRQQRPSQVPCLFVYGTTDTMVLPERTISLMETFPPECQTTFVHPGGHYVPSCRGDFKTVVFDFLDKVEAVATESKSTAEMVTS